MHEGRVRDVSAMHARAVTRIDEFVIFCLSDCLNNTKKIVVRSTLMDLFGETRMLPVVGSLEMPLVRG